MSVFFVCKSSEPSRLALMETEALRQVISYIMRLYILELATFKCPNMCVFPLGVGWMFDVLMLHVSLILF